MSKLTLSLAFAIVLCGISSSAIAQQPAQSCSYRTLGPGFFVESMAVPHPSRAIAKVTVLVVPLEDAPIEVLTGPAVDDPTRRSAAMRYVAATPTPGTEVRGLDITLPPLAPTAVLRGIDATEYEVSELIFSLLVDGKNVWKGRSVPIGQSGHLFHSLGFTGMRAVRDSDGEKSDQVVDVLKGVAEAKNSVVLAIEDAEGILVHNYNIPISTIHSGIAAANQEFSGLEVRYNPECG